MRDLVELKVDIMLDLLVDEGSMEKIPNPEWDGINPDKKFIFNPAPREKPGE
jgi:hypothetical protein